ncbi:MAG TPA: prepilin-type N-terminal cleavage/methylation domain-containing protein [Tepidisphaeraceae bacterium]|nr:prepilin-type N-terminal cleavage/methylation domain-containing protein [Tepidisphaeraceae bacterium]
MRNRKAFTLVELLVVIGIIALLIGILVPVLSKARASSVRTKCLSNVRSMQIAQWAYATSNRGYLIQGGMSHGTDHANEELTWFNVLNKYFGGKLAARCPGDMSPHFEVPMPTTTDVFRRTSYGINAFLDRDLCPWGPGFSEPDPNGQYVKIEQIKQASTVIQFVEMAWQGDYAASDHVHPNLFATQFTPSAAIPARAAQQMQINAHGGAINWQARANYGFLDGHAESLTLREVFTSIYVNHFDPASPQPLP